MTRKYTIGTFCIELFLWLISLVFWLPFAMVVFNSLKTSLEASVMKLTLPNSLQWSNFTVVIEQGKLAPAFLNSLLISISTVVLSVLLAAMGSFVIARNQSKLNKVIYSYIMIGMVAPISIIPTVKVLQSLHIMNTFHGLILLLTGIAIPFSMLLIKGFVITVPKELDESALMDGCNPLKMFFFIIFPILKPIVVTLAILSFTSVWNEFTMPLYFLNSSDKWPLTLAVFNFFGRYNRDWNLVCADILLTMLPIIVVFLTGQRYIISGMSAGAVKG